MKELLLALFATFDQEQPEHKLHILARLEGMTRSKKLKAAVKELRPKYIEECNVQEYGPASVASLEDLV